MKSLQETYAPTSACFGCGPANSQGLRIRSILCGCETIAEWRSEKHHEAFPGMVNGGIIGSLLDCHSNWTAAAEIMKFNGLGHPPCTVTADYHIRLLRPTPSNELITLKARATQVSADRATIQAELIVAAKICATCVGTFVAVKPGHPAYHRW